MDLTLYQELFEYSACPIFAFSDSGRIIYRNPSAKKYLPMLRKNASLTPHLYPSVLPKKSSLLHIVGDTPYHTVIALRDGNVFVAFGLVRLQLSDGYAFGSWLLRGFSDGSQSLARLLQAEKERLACHHPSPVSRVYTDIFETLNYAKEWRGMCDDSFDETVRILFEKLRAAFTAFGYRIEAVVDDSFLHHRAVRMRSNDFLFIFGIFLYMQMRLSANGDISVLLKSENDKHILRFSVRTEKICLQTEDIFLFLKSCLPECAWELHLLQQLGFLEAQALRFFYDHYGVFTVEYDIPCTEEATPVLQSISISSYLSAADTDCFLDAVRRWLTDNGASY